MFEHEDYHAKNLGQEVIALLIRARFVKGGGYSLGYIWLVYYIYSYLCEGPEGRVIYERIGAGKLSGKEVGREFRIAERRQVELV